MHFSVRMAARGNRQMARSSENPMRILRRNVDHVPGTHRNVLTVDVHETLALDHIKNVITRMRVHGKATPRFEPDEIATEVSAVRLLGANTASAGDPDENSTTWIN